MSRYFLGHREQQNLRLARSQVALRECRQSPLTSQACKILLLVHPASAFGLLCRLLTRFLRDGASGSRLVIPSPLCPPSCADGSLWARSSSICRRVKNAK